MYEKIIDRINKRKFVLIAEIGVNYYDIGKKLDISDIEAAKLMIDKAKDAGVHAVKFQTYKADTLAVKNSPAYWNLQEEATASQYELFKKFDSFNESDYKELYDYCEHVGIEFLSTPFDINSVDYLDEILSVFKISSSDLNNYPLITYIAKKNKSIILSTGASNKEEIDKAISWIRKYNNKQIILMHCVLEYPTQYKNANLNKIISLRKEYPDMIIGYSDHTKPDKTYEIIKTAYNLGAIVIEKHFTIDKKLIGNDHYHSMDDSDAKKIIQSIEFIDKIRGNYELDCLNAEYSARLNARRSIVSDGNILCGEIITKNMLTFKRPGTGIPVYSYEDIIGRHAPQDIP